MFGRNEVKETELNQNRGNFYRGNLFKYRYNSEENPFIKNNCWISLINNRVASAETKFTRLFLGQKNISVSKLKHHQLFNLYR